MDPKGRLRRARERIPEMVALLRDLIEIESPSTDAAAVAAFAERVAGELRALELEVELLPMSKGGPVLRARREGPSPLMLLGHLDTVWPVGTLAARPLRIDGDLLFGPGGYDMKAGIVVMIFALRLLRES